MAYTPSDPLVDLVARFEGYAAEPYVCPAGKQTIGYGHVMRPGEVFELPLAEPDARALLRTDLAKFAAGVAKLVTRTLEPHQFDALVSFAFNVGIGALATSTLLKKVNAGDHAGAAAEFGRWVHGGGQVLPGLVARRQAEADLYRGGAHVGA